jgi:hypothetical protein
MRCLRRRRHGWRCSRSRSKNSGGSWARIHPPHRSRKVQQRTSGGCWRTLQGLADFAIVQSYLSTAAKWGIDALDALTQLLATGPWLPATIRPG